MSRKPSDTTTRKTGAKKTGSKKPKAGRKKRTDVEETPITISGGSILVASVLEREETGVKKHKKCKIKDDPGRKWKIVRAEIHQGLGGPLQSYLLNEDDTVIVFFKRPSA